MHPERVAGRGRALGATALLACVLSAPAPGPAGGAAGGGAVTAEEALRTMRGAYCGSGAYPDPSDPYGLPGFERPVRVGGRPGQPK